MLEFGYLSGEAMQVRGTRESTRENIVHTDMGLLLQMMLHEKIILKCRELCHNGYILKYVLFNIFISLEI